MYIFIVFLFDVLYNFTIFINKGRLCSAMKLQSDIVEYVTLNMDKSICVAATVIFVLAYGHSHYLCDQSGVS